MSIRVWWRNYEKNLKSLDVIQSNECILDIIEEEGFEDDYMKVLEELALHIDGSRANVITELHSR